VEAELRETPCDVIYAPLASALVAYLETDRPIVYLSDATWALIGRYYPEYEGLPEEVAAQRDELERRTIARADRLIYTSHWAAGSAVRDYGADPGKIRVLPFGANLVEAPAFESVVARRPDGVCRLVFISKNWRRKGGDIALETVAALEAMGVSAELTIIGTAPPEGTSLPAGVILAGYLDKNRPEHNERFRDILRQSHVMLLPTRADCSPIICCEAAAYGLPVAATATGGVAELVQDGVTGWTLPVEARGEAYARAIADAYGDARRFESMSRTARARYDERLNWRAWGVDLREEIRRVQAAAMASRGSR
jgi:glycosyltransferase involved in cell wall biosynthesis